MPSPRRFPPRGLIFTVTSKTALFNNNRYSGVCRGQRMEGNPMRHIAYGLAILAAVFAVAFTSGYLPRDATASHNEANTMNVPHLEEALYR